MLSLQRELIRAGGAGSQAAQWGLLVLGSSWGHLAEAAPWWGWDWSTGQPPHAGGAPWGLGLANVFLLEVATCEWYLSRHQGQYFQTTVFTFITILFLQMGVWAQEVLGQVRILATLPGSKEKIIGTFWRKVNCRRIWGQNSWQWSQYGTWLQLLSRFLSPCHDFTSTRIMLLALQEHLAPCPPAALLYHSSFSYEREVTSQ